MLAFAAPSEAGAAGWLSSDVRDWEFVLRACGVRISSAIEKDGKRALPVEYDVTGLSTTCRPTLINSGLAVRRIDVERIDAGLVIRVVTQLVEVGTASGRMHYADRGDIPKGTCEIYCEDAGDAARRLERIDIR